MLVSFSCFSSSLKVHKKFAKKLLKCHTENMLPGPGTISFLAPFYDQWSSSSSAVVVFRCRKAIFQALAKHEKLMGLQSPFFCQNWGLGSEDNFSLSIMICFGEIKRNDPVLRPKWNQKKIKWDPHWTLKSSFIFQANECRKTKHSIEHCADCSVG